MWVKICGVTGTEALAAALAAGVDAVGFVFAPSVRRLDPAQAARLAAPARGRVELIAVTLHPSQVLIDEILLEFRPDALQSDVADFDRLRLPATLSRLPVLRAELASGRQLPARLLFEGAVSGTATMGDWDQATLLARRSNLILAGGLDARNVAAAIGAVRPYGVDVSSGVEHTPGQKSPELIMQFVRAARGH